MLDLWATMLEQWKWYLYLNFRPENYRVGPRIIFMISYTVWFMANSMIWRPSWTPSWIYGKECFNSESNAFIKFLRHENHVVGPRIFMISHILCEVLAISLNRRPSCTPSWISQNVPILWNVIRQILIQYDFTIILSIHLSYGYAGLGCVSLLKVSLLHNCVIRISTSFVWKTKVV